MRALIDGDIVVYRSAFAAEHTRYTLHDTKSSPDPADWEEIHKFDNNADMKKFIEEQGLSEYAVTTDKEVEPVENVLYSVKHTIKSICDQIKAKEFTVYLSKGECFRHKRATLAKYKGNRDNTPRPVHYQAARDYLLKHYDAVICEEIEADDALAMNQTGDTCICSIDKDLLQIEGRHFNWVKGTKTLVKPRAALCRLWEQVLTGDSTDNIPGIKGIGAAKATKLIAACTNTLAMENLCVKMWDEALKTGKVQKIDVVRYDKGLVHYNNAEGVLTIKTVRDIVKEIYMLIKVGGDIAQEALDERTRSTEEGS